MKQVLLWSCGIIFFLVLVTGMMAFLESANNFKYCFFLFLLIAPYIMWSILQDEKKKEADYRGWVALLGLGCIVMGIVVFLNMDTMKAVLSHETGISQSVIGWLIFILGGLGVTITLVLGKDTIEKR